MKQTVKQLKNQCWNSTRNSLEKIIYVSFPQRTMCITNDTWFSILFPTVATQLSAIWNGRKQTAASRLRWHNKLLQTTPHWRSSPRLNHAGTTTVYIAVGCKTHVVKHTAVPSFNCTNSTAYWTKNCSKLIIRFKSCNIIITAKMHLASQWLALISPDEEALHVLSLWSQHNSEPHLYLVEATT